MFNQFNPVAGILLLAGIFTGISLMVFEKITHAGWIYTALAVVSIMELQSRKGNDFLEKHVDNVTFYRCKLAENMLVLLPFIVVLIFKHCFLQAVILAVFVIPYSYYNLKFPRPKLKALHSPFLSYAVEWHNGFRMYAGVYVLHVLLLVPGVISGNFYVYLVPFFLLLFFMNSTYGVVEDRFFIWVYRSGAGQFLLKKFKALAAGYALSFALFAVVGAIFYPQHIALLLLCLSGGLIALTGSMLIKYHFYPSEFIIQVSQIIFLALVVGGVINPSLMILTLLMLLFSYFKARNKLQTILGC